MICEACKLRFHDFYNFKKQCDFNADILIQVRNDMENMQTIDTETNATQDLFEESYENIPVESVEEVEETHQKKTKKNKKSSSKKAFKDGQKKGSQCTICGKIVKGIQMHMLIHAGLKKHSK
jgi:hypothetical protein